MKKILDFPVQYKRPRSCSACPIGVPPPPQMEERQRGYRFHPRDDEVILVPRMRRQNRTFGPIRYHNVYQQPPEELQQRLGVHHKDEMWVYTVLLGLRDGKEKRSIRNGQGIWKKSKDIKVVIRDDEVVGATRSCSYYGENGRYGGWIMKEYYLRSHDLARHGIASPAIDLVVCCIRNTMPEEPVAQQPENQAGPQAAGQGEVAQQPENQAGPQAAGQGEVAQQPENQAGPQAAGQGEVAQQPENQAGPQAAGQGEAGAGLGGN